MSAVPSDHGAVRPEPPTTYYEGVIKVPGFEAPPDRCRGLTPVGFCDHGHTVLGRSSCGTRYCEDHWRDWCEDAVISMVARMAAYRHAVEGAEKPASHVVASPPQERRYSAREMWDTRSEAYDALEAAGVDGGPVVTHPYRTNERANNLFETAKASGEADEDMGRWAFLRDVAEDWEDMSRYVEASPHYHVPVAPRRYVDGEAAPDGWVVKRLRKLRAFHIRDTEAYRDMVASAYYVLTHTADQTGRQSTTWFGEAHPATFDPAEELTAAAWSRIQMEAEKAVKEEPGEDGEGGVSGGPDECPREECEAVVRDMMYLPEFLEDEEWVASVLDRRGGAARVARLRGALVWWDGMADTPPPHVRSDEERMRRWLKSEGQEYRASSRRSPSAQVSLSTAVMS
jgi:hypothetical protein